MAKYFFCSNRYSKTLSERNSTFEELARDFKTPKISETKDTSGIFPGFYTSPYRNLEYVTHHNVLLIDVDKTEQSNIILHKVLGKDPVLYKYNFIVYSTFSSTKTNPRFRIVIELDPNVPSNQQITCDHYGAAIRTMQALLEVEFDPCSQKLNSFCYVPTVRPAEDFFCASNLSGSPFTKEEIHANTYVTQRPIDPLSSSESTENIGTETLEAMIYSIDPDVEYETWFKIISAIHHYSNGQDWGFALIDGWSKRGTKYAGQAATLDKWNSITDRTSNPVTVGTLIYEASACGWRGKQLTNAFKSFKEEIDARNHEFVDERVIFEICEKISKYPFAGYHLSELIDSISKTYATILDLTSSKGADKKIAKRFGPYCQYGGRPMDRDAQTQNDIMPEFLRDYVYVTKQKSKYVIDTKCPLCLDGKINRMFDDEFNKKFHMHRIDTEDDLFKRMTSEYQLPIAHTMVFLPGKETLFTTSDGQSHLNMFVKDETFQIVSESQLSDDSKECLMHLERFFDYFHPDSDTRHIFLNYLAHAIFNFGDKMKWAPLISTNEGFGKDLVMHLIQVALGNYNRYYTKTSGDDFFKSSWTAYLEFKALVYVNEVSVTGNDAYNNYNKVKSLITESDYMPIKEKYQEDRSIRQSTNYVFSTNTHNPLPIPPTERRIFLMKPEENHYSEYAKLRLDIKPTLGYLWGIVNLFGYADVTASRPNTKNLDDLKKQVRMAVLVYFHSFIENIHPEFDPKGHAKITPEFLRMQETSKLNHESILDLIIEDAEVKYANEFFISRRLTYDEIVQRGKDYDRSFRMTHNTFYQMLSSKGYIRVGDWAQPNGADLYYLTNPLFGVGTKNTKDTVYLKQKELDDWVRYHTKTNEKITSFMKVKMLPRYKQFLLAEEFEVEITDPEKKDSQVDDFFH